MLIKTGELKKNNGNQVSMEQYNMRLIAERDLKEVVSLQEYVYSQLPNKQVLYVDSYDEMLMDMRSGAKILGVYNEEEELIAYRYVAFPGYSEKNLGNDIKLSQDELDQVVHLETTVVHPSYRGNSLQSLTLQHMVPIVKSLGYRHLMCTVSPQNAYSLMNIMKNGLKIKALKKKYGTDQTGKDGLWRFILHKDLEPAGLTKPDSLFRIQIGDLEKQKKLINEGFIGYWLFKENMELSYVRFDSCFS